MKLKEIQKQKKQLMKQLNELNKAEDEIMARKFIICHHCKKKTRVSDLYYLHYNYYVEPYSGPRSQTGLLSNSCTATVRP